MSAKLKRFLSLMLSIIMIITLVPGGTLRSFAAKKDITITDFYYINTQDAVANTYQIVIEGTDFIQKYDPASQPVTVIDDVLVGAGAKPISLMKGTAQSEGVKVEISNSLITITAPKGAAKPFDMLNIVENGDNTITVNTNGDLDHNIYKFVAHVGGLVSMDTLASKTNYVGNKLLITGHGLADVDDVIVAGASHAGKMKKTGDTRILLNPLGGNKLNASESIQFIKRNDGNELFKGGTSTGKKVNVQFTSEKLNTILVLEKLKDMDNLLVLPNEGPNSRPSKITVFAMDKAGKKRLEKVFNKSNELYLRREVGEKIEELKLTDVKLIYKVPDDETSPVIGIEGWTPIGTRPAPSIWDMVVKDKNKPNSEGIKRRAFTFSTSDPAPQIKGIEPAEGPDTGGTDVLITGKNIFNVVTPGLKIGDVKVDKIIPDGDATVIDNTTLRVKYKKEGPSVLTYSGKEVVGVSRDIKVRIASMTNQRAGTIYQLPSPPKTGDVQDSKPYGQFHFMADGTDGIVVTTTNASTGGPQDVIMDIETTLTFKDGSTITIPEAAKFSSFTYNEKNPTPSVEGITVEYGFYNDSKEEDEPPADAGQADDGVKPIMIRLTGQKFEAIKKPDGTMDYPKVSFVYDGKVIPTEASASQQDTKVLDDKGNPIDGVYNKIGTTLVLSIIPTKTDKYGVRHLVQLGHEQENAMNIEAIIQVTNPSGNHNTLTNDSVKFQFRRPKEAVDETGIDSKQPEIIQVTANGTPVKKLSSDSDTPIEIRVKSTQLPTDLKKVRVTVDGLDISDKIKDTKLEGQDAVINVTVPKGFVGKSRIQVIVPEGLMDSYNIIFDNVRGPEIKELVPPEGDNDTIVVIKRDTQANQVSFKTPIPESENPEEQKGSKVLWNGIDINERFNGYVKDGSGNIVPQKSEYFKDFKQVAEGQLADFVNTPGKYVYVVDADTIYLKIPSKDVVEKGKYNIQIKNPDGSESSNGKIFTIIDAIDKTKIGTIVPNTDDITGGLVVTITAGEKDGRQTNFKGGVDVYFGSQKAEVVGYDIDEKEVYVKVPPLVDFKFPETLQEKVMSYTVPVTLQNKVNKSTDTKTDGFIYLNPNYKMEITQIYNEKYATDPSNAEAKKGVEGDFVIIRGKNFRLETGADGKYILPKVMFGYTMADVPVAFGAKNVNPDGSPQTDAQGRAELEWVKVKVPKRPTIGIGTDGATDVLVQNPDGAKTIAQKGFIYKQSSPTINEKASILTASRFHDTISVSAKDINKDGLIVAFGNKKYEKALSSSPMEVETTKEVEKIVVKYNPNAANNIEVYYKNPDGTLILMTDAEGLNAGKGRIGAIGDKLIVGINWKNPAYHSTDIKKNPELIATLNTEYMEISTENKAPNLNVLTVRRGLGKVTSFAYDATTAESKITIETPYNEKAETTTITLINSDGSSAKAPFIFHGGIEAPKITDIDGSKDRDLTIEGKPVKSKVFTNDYTTDADITVIGANFKDIERVMVGNKDVEVLNVSSDYTKIKIRVPKGNLDQVGKPLPITVVTKGGNGYSNLSVPPVFYMYIQAGSKPILSDVNPKKGPQTGGTKVVINGAGFSDVDEFGTKGEIQVYFAGKLGKISKLLKDEKGEIVGIEAIIPAVDMIDETINLYVKNADEGKSEPLPFQYVSQPVIEKLEGTFRLDAEKLDDAQDVKVTVIGKNFYNPEKVIIGGKLLKVDKNKDAQENQMMLGVKDDGANQYVELQKDKNGVENGIAVTKIEQPQPKGAKPAANEKAKEKNTTSFVVTMPIITYEQMQSMTSKSIIVVDQDGGTSPEKPADIKLPVPQAPKLIAVPGYNGSIGLSWSYKPTDPNRATRFEVYAKESGKGDYVHVGDVVGDINKTDYSYIIKDLKPDTEYQVKLRVMNKFGEAQDFGYAKVRTLRPEDDPKAKEQIKEMQRSQDNVRQNGTQKMVGDQLQYTVGTTEKVIDLSKYTANKKQVRIPVSQIKLAPNTTIQVIDKGMSMSVPFNAFTLNQVTSATDHAVVAIDFVTGDNKQNTTVTRAIPKNKQRASEVYKINFAVVEPKKKYPISFTNAPLALALTANQSGYTVFAQYDEKTGKIVQNANKNIKNGGYYVLLKNK